MATCARKRASIVWAAGPPGTCDGNTYVGQTWDWMKSAYGLSSMLRWKRTEGPDVLAYSYPGLWMGAGMNSEGLALCWTSAVLDRPGPRLEYVPFRPRLKRWSAELAAKYWVAPREVATEIVQTINDQNIQRLFQDVP